MMNSNYFILRSFFLFSCIFLSTHLFSESFRYGVFYFEKGDLNKVLKSTSVNYSDLKQSPYDYPNVGFSYHDKFCRQSPKDAYEKERVDCMRSNCKPYYFVVLPCQVDYDKMSPNDWERARQALGDFYSTFESKKALGSTSEKIMFQVLEWATLRWKKRQELKEQQKYNNKLIDVKKNIKKTLFENPEIRAVEDKISKSENCENTIKDYEKKAESLKKKIEKLLEDFKASLEAFNQSKSSLKEFALEAQSQVVTKVSDDISHLLSLEEKIRRLDHDNQKESYDMKVNSEHLKEEFDALIEKYRESISKYCDDIEFSLGDVEEKLVSTLQEIINHSLKRKEKFEKSCSKTILGVKKRFDLLAKRLAILKADEKTRDGIHLESSGHFLSLVSEKAEFLKSNLESSQFYGLPYLKKRLQSYYDFLSFSLACQFQDEDNDHWMSTGCINLKRHKEEIHEKLNKLPSDMQSYLSVARMLSNPELKELLSMIETLLEKSELQSAVSLYDEMLKKGGETFVLHDEL